MLDEPLMAEIKMDYFSMDEFLMHEIIMDQICDGINLWHMNFW